MTTEEILADDSADRRRRMCRCFTCGIVERCTPERDFYTTPATGRYLVCTTCFRRVTASSNTAYKSEIRFPCTFCDGKLEFARAVGDPDDIAVIHLEPVCTKYKDTPLLDFLGENRRNLGIPDIPDDLEPDWMPPPDEAN
jgi:hypothetical protein